MTFKFGTATVPDGKLGDWSITTFTLYAADVMMGNLRAIRDGNPELVCPPGTYRRLHHRTRGVVMSNTPMEVHTALEAYHGAVGRVLINGLGLGMVLEGVLAKSGVTYVRVVELDADVIALVAPHFAGDSRVEIIHADAYEYKPAKGEVFDFVWHDIWDTIDSDNLPLMNKLTRKYSRRTIRQGVWSRDMARRQKRRESRQPSFWGW